MDGGKQSHTFKFQDPFIDFFGQSLLYIHSTKPIFLCLDSGYDLGKVGAMCEVVGYTVRYPILEVRR